MSGMFVPAESVVRETLDWGMMGWCCRPSGTGLEKLVVIEVDFAPGGGHAFHKHPSQEEVIYCVEGEAEQWLDRQKRTLRPGDCVVIPAGVVHASFNTTGGRAKLLAILGPATDGENGYEVIEVADEEPWKSLK